MNKISIAVAGPGLIGREHISLIKKNSRCRLHSIISPVVDTPNEDVMVFNSIQDCLRQSTPDGVIISSPTQYHYEQAALCAELGIKCLVEKPICGSSSEAIKLLETRDSELNISVGHHRHYSPIIDAAKQILLRENIGELRTVIASAQYFKPDDYYLEKNWRVLPGSGGVLLINAIHDIGLLRYLVGEVESVQAFGRRSRMSSEIYGTVSVNLMFANGVIGSLVVSDEVSSINSWEVTSGENKSFPNYYEGFAYVFGGTRGSLTLPSGDTYIDRYNNGWKTKLEKSILAHEVKDPLSIQLDHFIDTIEHNVLPKVGIRDGINNLAVIDAIASSLSNTGEPTKVVKY